MANFCDFSPSAGRRPLAPRVLQPCRAGVRRSGTVLPFLSGTRRDAVRSFTANRGAKRSFAPQQRGAPVLAEIIGYGISTDNFHITQPDPSGIGPRQAMERALQSGGISAAEVDYINAHGTATVFNDAAEGKAISAVFNGVPVSSTKSMMGHSLGAAGAVEAVFCLLALQHQFLPSNINFTASDDDLDLNIVGNETRPAVLRTALSNSFGFGGTNASILMRSFKE